MSKKGKLIFIGSTVIALVCVFAVIYASLGRYGGLGELKDIPLNEYSMDSIYTDNGIRFYEDDSYQSVAGIDVSYHQNSIDWEKVKASGVDFAMIRVGYRGYETGEIVLDSMFNENISGARKAGLDVGVYFFSQAITPEEAIEEARFTVRHIRGKGVRYPVAFDMEPINGADRITHLTTEEKTQIADAFCNVIDRNFYTPMIYGNYYWLQNDIELEYLTEYDTWLAHYAEETSYPYKYKFWQYTETGTVPGVDGYVDINICFVESN